MPYSIRYDFKTTYLHVTVEGDNTPEVVQQYLMAIDEMCKARHCRNLLIEENLTGQSISALDIFSIINKAARESLPVLNRIAYVDVNPEHDPKGMQFAETVARNRGVFVRIFPNVKSAERWLIQPE